MCLITLVNISMRENLLAVSGNPESKEIKDLMPEILKQVGPQQYGFLKDLIDAAGKPAGEGEAADDEDDVPPLVEGNFEQAASKWGDWSEHKKEKTNLKGILSEWQHSGRSERVKEASQVNSCGASVPQNQSQLFKA